MIRGKHGTEPRAERPRLSAPALPRLDRIDKVIIEELQRDGRVPFEVIARSLDLTVDVVRSRVDALIAAGVILITAVSEPSRVGFGCQAMLGITVAQEFRRPVAERLQALPQVVYLVITGGDFQLLAEVLAPGEEDLRALIDTVITPLPGVRCVHPFVYRQLHKQTYTWNVR